MKKHLIALFFFAALSLPVLRAKQPGIPPGTKTLTMRIDNVLSSGGVINVAVYTCKKDFLNEKKAILYRFEVTGGGSQKIEIPDMPFGVYAFAVFHDLDGDNVLDTNFFGVPTEPYGFSGSNKSRWLPPSFEEAKFLVDHVEKDLCIRLSKWKL